MVCPGTMAKYTRNVPGTGTGATAVVLTDCPPISDSLAAGESPRKSSCTMLMSDLGRQGRNASENIIHVVIRGFATWF